MLLKISLGLAILVGLATLYFTHVQVGGKIVDLNSRIQIAEGEKNSALEAQAKAQDDAKKAKTSFEASSKELNMATNLLTQVTKDFEEQRKRANIASSNLVAVTEDRNVAQQELSRWRGIGLPPERIISELAAKKSVEAERNALLVDKTVFTRDNRRLQAELDKYIRPEDREIPLPAGTKGKVVAYDPKYEFVVLDIGGNQGLVENAKMLINRDGKLVAKVKITHVEPNRAIANLMPEWKQDDVLEGDQAIY